MEQDASKRPRRRERETAILMSVAVLGKSGWCYLIVPEDHTCHLHNSVPSGSSLTATKAESAEPKATLVVKFPSVYPARTIPPSITTVAPSMMSVLDVPSCGTRYRFVEEVKTAGTVLMLPQGKKHHSRINYVARFCTAGLSLSVGARKTSASSAAGLKHSKT